MTDADNDDLIGRDYYINDCPIISNAQPPSLFPAESFKKSKWIIPHRKQLLQNKPALFFLQFFSFSFLIIYNKTS